MKSKSQRLALARQALAKAEEKTGLSGITYLPLPESSGANKLAREKPLPLGDFSNGVDKGMGELFRTISQQVPSDGWGVLVDCKHLGWARLLAEGVRVDNLIVVPQSLEHTQAIAAIFLEVADLLILDREKLSYRQWQILLAKARRKQAVLLDYRSYYPTLSLPLQKRVG
ncbi:hypothetical protein BK816_05310 [Boudabousia tangfeifanii]|uniref:Uncharacterized protein n=1 Tax=Boudabousia tangfeifanii TaxID=1912795 RepID=A0A1D9MKH7_9ACTO|nr:hypothetical protein [Boudabousia tangfeifanii]AOZ72782.1 hypothetical protein BK816_05310 [Boudabousia tangfeifanii]